jgi:LPXTG-motif cell wall-anchored protein
VDCSEIETTTTTIPDEVLPTVVTPTTLPPEVLPTEVVAPSTLPFTGAESDDLALIALALTGTGILFLVATRSKRED